MMFVLLGLLCFERIFCFGITPPVFPDQFTATFSGVDVHGSSYTGTYYFDLVNTVQRQDSNTKDGQYDFLDIYSTRKDYNYCSWIPQCVVWILVPPMRQWGVPSDSQYIGKETIRGLSCDHWKYSWSHGTLKETDDFWVFYNSTHKFWEPVKNVYWWSTSGTTKVEWLTFNPTAPDPNVFNIPQSWDCEEVERVKLGGFSRTGKPGFADEGCPPT